MKSDTAIGLTSRCGISEPGTAATASAKSRQLVRRQAEQLAQRIGLQRLAAGEGRAEAQRGGHEQHVLDGAAGREHALGFRHLAALVVAPDPPWVTVHCLGSVGLNADAVQGAP